MTPRPLRRARAGLGARTGQRHDRLPKGALQNAALAHMRAHPDLDFSPAELANLLQRPNSRSAIAKACRNWTTAGLTIQTRHDPNRYSAAPPAHITGSDGA